MLVNPEDAILLLPEGNQGLDPNCFLVRNSVAGASYALATGHSDALAYDLNKN